VARVPAPAGVRARRAAAVPIPLHDRVAIGGFARLSWSSSGVRDPVFARALVLSQGEVDVALVSVEVCLLPAVLTRAVERALDGDGIEHLVVAATHTHAGPGGYWSDPIVERAGLGPFDAAFAERLAATIAEAVRGAAAARAPAELRVAHGEAAKLARNRAGGEVDGRLVSIRLRAREGGEPIAEVVLFPAHPTILGKKNEQISGDWPGALARLRKQPTLVFQGAVGDQSARPPRGRNAHERYARRIRNAIDALPAGEAEPLAPLAAATVSAVLPAPDLGASPPILRRLTKNVLYGWFPDRTVVTAVRLGPVTLLAIPGEPVAAVGAAWRARAGEGAEVLALANDYVGYVETEQRMAEEAGETGRTYYGPELADRLGAAVELAARSLDEEAEKVAQNRTAGEPSAVQVR
jgi:hypothetical protein